MKKLAFIATNIGVYLYLGKKAGPEPIPRTAFYDEVSNDSK